MPEYRGVLRDVLLKPEKYTDEWVSKGGGKWGKGGKGGKGENHTCIIHTQH